MHITCLDIHLDAFLMSGQCLDAHWTSRHPSRYLLDVQTPFIQTLLEIWTPTWMLVRSLDSTQMIIRHPDCHLNAYSTSKHLSRHSFYVQTSIQMLVWCLNSVWMLSDVNTPINIPTGHINTNVDDCLMCRNP